MRKEQIKSYIGVGLLSAAFLTGGGLAIHDKHVDHTKEVCPITKISNKLFGNLDIGTIHQMDQMFNDYDKIYGKYNSISYGPKYNYDTKNIPFNPSSSWMDKHATFEGYFIEVNGRPRFKMK